MTASEEATVAEELTLVQVIRRAILAWHIANDPADDDGEGLDEAIARAVEEWLGSRDGEGSQDG